MSHDASLHNPAPLAVGDRVKYVSTNLAIRGTGTVDRIEDGEFVIVAMDGRPGMRIACHPAWCRRITDDHGEADGVILALSLSMMAVVLVVAKWGLAGVAWLGVVFGGCSLLLALTVLCASHDHSKDYDERRRP